MPTKSDPGRLPRRNHYQEGPGFLHGEIGWLTPAERYNGTPFTDRLFENIPALTAVAELLQAA